jgi:hypothetical protein
MQISPDKCILLQIQPLKAHLKESIIFSEYLSRQNILEHYIN